MSNKIFYQNIEFQNAQKTPKKNGNFNLNQKNYNINQNDKFKSPNSLNNKNNKYYHNNNAYYNEHIYNIDKQEYNNSFMKPKKNEFISISEIPEIDNDNIYDNFNYLNIIQSSMAENKNPNKIKTVDANNYLNYKNNSISTFTDFKFKLLNDNKKFNCPFVFYKNNIDLTNSKKIEEEKNYQIRRYRYLSTYKYSFNPDIQRKNSKIIQKWWRQKINPKIDKRKKIIKIQSFFRGYYTRKCLNDIIFISVLYQNFINKLQHALGKYVRRNYFPKRYYKKKYALEKIFPLKIKLFFRRWRNRKEKLNEKENATKLLFKIRDQKRNTLFVLKTYFDIWRLKCEKFRKNEDKNLTLKNQNKKYLALSNLFNNLEKIKNKNAFNLCKDNIHKYLVNTLQNKFANKIMQLYNKYNIRRKLKKIFEIWRTKNWKEKERNLKLKVLANQIKAQIRKNDKDFIRNNLNNLRAKTNLQTINNLKRAKKEFLFPKGIKHIVNSIRKNIIRFVFKDYLRKINIKKKLLKILRKKMMRYFLKKWNKIVKSLLHKSQCLLYLKKNICRIGRLSYNRILKKYFNKWKGKAIMNKYKEKKINIYNEFCESLKKYINNNKNLNKCKSIFLKKKIKNYINTNSVIIKKKILKCINNYSNKNKILSLKKALNKWKKYVQLCKLNDLKAKNLETVSRLTKIIYDTKKLSKNLHDWQNKNNLENFNNKYKYNNNINNLIDCIKKMKNDRMKQFFNNIKAAKYNLMKKLILKILFNKNEKKKLSYYFNKYKINTIKLQNKYKFSNLDKINKLKVVLTNKIKRDEKNEYGALKKYLFKWYLISKLINKENYEQFLLNMKNAINTMNSVINENALKKPFQKIKFTEVNKKNIALKRLKKYFIKNDKINLRDAFHKFLKKSLSHSRNILKSNIIYNLRLKKEQMRNRTLLTKYFNKWKMINRIYNDQRDKTIILVTYTLQKIIKQKYEKQFFKKIKKKSYKYGINYISKKLFKIYIKVEKRKLSKVLIKWRNNAQKLNLFMNKRKKVYNNKYNTSLKANSLKKLKENLIPLFLRSLKKRYYKDFFEKMKKLFPLNINCTYKAKLKNELNSRKYNFIFKKTIKPNYSIYNSINKKEEKKEVSKINQDARSSRYKIPITLLNRRKVNNIKENEKIIKNIVISNSDSNKNKTEHFYNERLMPYLVNYLNELRLKRLRLVFEYLIWNKNNNLFCILFKSWVIKQNNDNKQNFLKILKQSSIRQKLILLMRRKIIHKLTTKYLIEINRRNKLLISVHKIRVFKKINKKKKIIRILRIWRVYTRYLKDRAAKLEKIEKSFNETYEKLNDSLFVDNADEKSIQTQINCFLDKITQEETNKIKNSLGVSQSSLNSYLSTKHLKNELLNSYNHNYNLNNDNNDNNDSIYSFSRLNYENDDNKSLNTSKNNIKSSVFSRHYRKNKFV